jgi:alkylation response protein AidB-like acyl-CoA dehydrogenase
VDDPPVTPGQAAHLLTYAKERVQLGRAIIDNQAIAFALADMKMETTPPGY